MKKLMYYLVIMCLLPLLLANARPAQGYLGTWKYQDKGRTLVFTIFYNKANKLVLRLKENARNETILCQYDKGKVTFRMSENKALFILSLNAPDRLVLHEENDYFGELVKQ